MTTPHFTTCEVCKGHLPAPVLDLGLQPLCDDLVPVGDVRMPRSYPTLISLCPRCLTGHQLHRVKKEVLFPREYHYRARFTLDVLNGMRNLVEEVAARYGNLESALVCDIGCNDGSLLNFFGERRARTTGIEPTGAAADAAQNGHRILNAYFEPSSAATYVDAYGRPDIITFTNVFAHIDSLDQTIAALKLMTKPGTMIVIENHYLGSVLANGQFDTFYHEHPRTYSFRSFQFIAESLGGRLLGVSFPGRYGGNIRVFIGQFGRRPDATDAPQISGPDETSFPVGLEEMQRQVVRWREVGRARLAEARSSGFRLHGKSFPGRASILINLLGVDETVMPCIYEKTGSMKLGHYAPGTRIPIRDDREWIECRERPEAILLWAWHIQAEVVRYMRAAGYQGRFFAPLPEWREVSDSA